MALHQQIQAALAKRVFSSPSPPDSWPGYAGYTRRAEDNFVTGLDLRSIKKDLNRGQGSELKAAKNRPPKFHAAHSSSALIINTLGVFRDCTTGLQLAGTTAFDTLEFEYPCPTGAGRGVANLDVIAQSEECVVGIESKLCEILQPKPAHFSSKYDPVVTSLADDCWAAFFHDMKRNPLVYRHVDGAQLVKHYLGLRNTFNRKRAKLVYLFWEPENATRHEKYRLHATEINGLTERLALSSIPLVPMRYSELWASIEQDKPNHVKLLRQRYSLVV